MRPTPALLALALLASCGFGVRGSGVVETETRRVSEFSAIELSGSGHAVVTIGEDTSLEVEAEENILPLLRTEVSGDTLELGTVRGRGYSATEPVIFRIGVPNLERVSVSGSGSVEIVGLDEPSLEASISGSGAMRVIGEVGRLDVEISGSGEFDGSLLEAEDGTVSVSGSGQARVTVAGDLQADVSGSGSVRYIGEPDRVDTSISGSGSVEPLRG